MKNKILILSIVMASCILMGYIDAMVQPGYVIKSIIKISLFSTLPIAYFFITKDTMMKSLFTLSKQVFRTALVLGVSLYVLIVGSYLLLQQVVDFSHITELLSTNIGVTANNFIFVALYIAFVNSLLEEFFFRGFAFITLAQYSTKCFASWFSAITFSLYHVAMMIGWFSFPVFLLIMVSLVIGGLLFNWLNARFSSIYVSWMVHLCANLGINTVGLLLFGLV